MCSCSRLISERLRAGEPAPSLFAARFPWLAGLSHQNGLASLIDHTLLRPEASAVEIERLCDQALGLGFGAVCVNGAWV